MRETANGRLEREPFQTQHKEKVSTQRSASDVDPPRISAAGQYLHPVPEDSFEGGSLAACENA